MQITTGGTLNGKAGTATAVTYTISGDRKTTTDSYEVLGQGQLALATGALLTTSPVAASTQLLIAEILLNNATASPVTGIILYVNGTTAANQIVQISLVANGSAIYSQGRWETYDSGGNTLGGSGIVASVSNADGTTTVTGSATNPVVSRAAITGDVAIPGASTTSTLATVNSNVGTFGSNSRIPTYTINSKGLTTASSDTPILTTPSGQTPVGATRSIATTAPLTGGGDLSADRTLAISAATTTTAGSQSAVDKLKQDNAWYDIVAQGGADRTGIVDATAIIQAAIDSVATAGGGIVYIPRGTFKVTAAITITGNFVTVRGASRVASKLVPTQATGNIFTVSGIFNRFEYIRIEPTSFTNRTAGYAIEFTSTASNCGCQWVDILGMWSAIKATGQLCRLEDMNIRECGYGAANGCMVLIDSFTDQYLSKLVCDNGVTPPNAPQATFAGIRITNLSSLLMSDCQIIHCQVGLDAIPTSTNTIPSIYCMNTFFDNGTIGARFTPGSGNIYRCRFMGVWFSSSSTAGVQLLGASINGLDFIGCEFYGNPIGIDAQAATEWGVRASRFAGNTANAIKTTAGATHSFTISDNVIGNVSGFGANAQGINIQAGTYKRYQVLDNRGLESNTTPGVIDLGVVAATDQKNVANNMGGVLKGAISTLSAPLVVPVTTETLVLNARIPANGVSVGQVFRVYAVGILAGLNVCTWRVRVGAAGTVAGDTVVANIVLQPAAGVVNGRTKYEAYLTVRSLGAPGSCEGEGTVVWNTAANASSVASTTVAAAATSAITTTADWFIDISLSQTINSANIMIASIEAL